MAEVRIMSHMNKDHSLSIEDYLVVYGKVPLSNKISNIKMTEITLDHMTISFKHEDIEFDVTKLIPFEPPLENLSQARTKLVEMAKFASAKRGLSHFQIKDYRYPGVLGWLLILLIHLPIICYTFPSLLKLNVVTSILPESLLNYLQQNALHVFFLTIFIHVGEANTILKPKLNKYRVPTEFKVEWYLSVVIEGFPAIRRLNALIAENTH